MTRILPVFTGSLPRAARRICAGVMAACLVPAHVAYLNLIGSYLTAAGRLNLAVGREVIQ
ncbi:MAG: hypothetical protein ABSE42_04590 [Bryobacteraceae bacterium]